ncbi:MAG: MaoC/PaaZ C-terminal domain-containing protein [Nocardioidaceae bacterium]
MPADDRGTRLLSSAPATLPLLAKAALPVLPLVNRLPGVARTGTDLPTWSVARRDVVVDRAHVAAYAQVCGFPVRDALPLTYPHLLAFGLHLVIMTDRSFPHVAMGTVHLRNTVTSHRAIGAREPLAVSARAGNARAHPKGRVFDLLTTVSSDEEPVWEETSTFLRPGRRGADATAAPEPRHDRLTGLDVPSPAGAPWQLAGDLGRRYAAVSGDRNPIHLYRLTARALGFRSPIAHGMWSLARCLAALQGRLPEAVTVEVAFTRPVFLPGAVGFGARRDGDDHVFALIDPASGASHLLGVAVAGD